MCTGQWIEVTSWSKSGEPIVHVTKEKTRDEGEEGRIRRRRKEKKEWVKRERERKREGNQREASPKPKSVADIQKMVGVKHYCV